MIRVPWIAGTPETKASWPGVSYVNSFLLDKTLFVPRFGLGSAEKGLFAQLRMDLPPTYRVVPIYSQHQIINGGGIHFISGIIRGKHALPEPHCNAP